MAMKTFKILLGIIAVLILIPVAGRLIWYVKKSRPMEIMIMNKTVPKANRNEVKSLNWVLNNKKFRKADGDNYDYFRDYYGYHPDAPGESWLIRSFRLENLPALMEQYDAFIFLDNAGVPADLPGNTLKADYGGLNQNDYLLLRELVNTNKLVIAEFNFFDEPTEDLVRFNTEQMIDVYSIGWKGKYFNNLNTKKIDADIDTKWLDRYKEYYGKNWDFEGPGMIFLNEKQNRIVVLPQEQYMTGKTPHVTTTEEYSKLYNIPVSAAFSGWFEVVYGGANEPICNFNLELNEAGIEMLRTAGLESKFPAVIKSVDKPLFYLAGDFSKESASMLFSRISILSNLVSAINKGRIEKPSLFFHTWYAPFMSAVLTDYQKGLIKED
jgi:hypothetical protein